MPSPPLIDRESPQGFTEGYYGYDESAARINMGCATKVELEKSAHFEDIYALRKEWCDLDTKWWDAKEGSVERKKLEDRMSEIVKELEKKQSDTYTTGRLQPTGNTPKPSAVFPGKKLGGLKTRRRKHRNGSTRVQRHRPSRLSRRKRQTRRA